MLVVAKRKSRLSAGMLDTGCKMQDVGYLIPIEFLTPRALRLQHFILIEDPVFTNGDTDRLQGAGSFCQVVHGKSSDQMWTYEGLEGIIQTSLSG